MTLCLERGWQDGEGGVRLGNGTQFGGVEWAGVAGRRESGSVQVPSRSLSRLYYWRGKKGFAYSIQRPYASPSVSHRSFIRQTDCRRAINALSQSRSCCCFIKFIHHADALRSTWNISRDLWSDGGGGRRRRGCTRAGEFRRKCAGEFLCQVVVLPL